MRAQPELLQPCVQTPERPPHQQAHRSPRLPVIAVRVKIAPTVSNDVLWICRCPQNVRDSDHCMTIHFFWIFIILTLLTQKTSVYIMHFWFKYYLVVECPTWHLVVVGCGRSEEVHFTLHGTLVDFQGLQRIHAVPFGVLVDENCQFGATAEVVLDPKAVHVCVALKLHLPEK